MTGGDPITARFMRQDFFTFAPTFKLVIAGNYKPGLRSVDEAVRRRLHLVPFTVQIPPGERDMELAEKLREEWPAILAWMIDGCLKWQEDGLRPPPVILAATEEYLQSCDAFSLWLSDCTERGGAYCWESSADLFASWKSWAEAAGEHAGTHRDFADQMRKAGFEAKRQGHTGKRGYSGIILKRHDYTDDRRYGG